MTNQPEQKNKEWRKELGDMVIIDLFQRGLSEIDAIHAKQKIEEFIEEKVENQVRAETAKEIYDELKEIIMNYQLSPEGRLRLVSDLIQAG